jgi:GT2 family glycosyltransferase/SAM-dependent methyltransferase/glycosyltransferase involved in cell wall biosynthesis
MKFTGEFFIPSDAEDTQASNRELEIEHKQRYQSILKLVEGKSVLDIASGEGYGSSMLASVASQVSGVDINPELVDHATKKYGKENTRFFHGSATSIPLEANTVDVVVSFETLEHISEQAQRQFILEVKRVLKPGGTFFVSTPNKKNYTERYDHHNEFHVHELSRVEFEGLLKSRFAHVVLYDQGMEVVSTLLNKEDFLLKKPILPVTIHPENYHFEGKYLIGICSDRSDAIQTPIASIVPESERSYLQLIDRTLQMQEEIEQLGTWGKRSNEELEAANSRILQLQEEVEQLGTWGKRSNEEVEVLNQRLSALSAELAKNSEIHEAQRQNNELEKTKGQLDKAHKNNYNTRKELERKSNQIYRLESEKKELENRLNEIFSSDGYKLLSLYYKFKSKFIPEGSGRQKKLKNFGRFLKKSTRLIPSKAAISTSVQVSATRLAQEYNIVPEVPEGIQFPLVFPVQEHPVVSIVIPAYNNWAFTRNCLISIYQYTQDVAYEIIVGDNVSTDETVDIEKYFSNITYLRNKENMGYILNINNAASHAKGEFILTLNNDTTVTPNWLSAMIDIFRKDPRAGLVGSKLVYPDGSLQEAGGIIWKDASAWNYGKGADPQAPEFNYVKEVDYISGASNLIRKDLWLQLKGLDERYVPAYFDDSDLAMSIRNLGYKVIYQPLSVVVHYEGLTHGTSTGSGTKRYQQLNHEKFVAKWKTVLAEQHQENGKDVFYARDNSARKKTIVVIDHYVPMFDKDAGSRTVFQYLDLFIDMGMNVKFIGDNFYRHEPYTTILQQKGIEVFYGSYYAENWLKWLTDNEKYVDYIFLNRPHISIKYIDQIKKKMHGKVFYYMHDLHFVREQKEYEITKEEAKLASALQWKETEYTLFKLSDVVLTPSTKEKEILTEDFPDKSIQVMPAFFYPSIAEPIKDFQNRKDLLFIGGFNHTPNVDAILWFADEVFPMIRKKNKDIRLIVVGSHAPEKVTKLASSSIIVKGFVPDQELEQIYKEVRLSVIPLRYGAGVKGKTAESLSKGLPIVSTSFGIEGLRGIDRFISPYDDAESFANAVATLYSNIPALETMSDAAVTYALGSLTKTSASVFFKTLFNL